jgi:hypothetical protein
MFCNGILAHLFIFKLLQVSLHDDLLLRLVHHLESLVEESGCMLLIRLLCCGDFHGWAVIANLAGYMISGLLFEYEKTQWITIKRGFSIYLLFLSTDTSVGG